MRDPNEKRVSLRKAAKEVGKSYAYVKDTLVEQGKVPAYRVGGDPEHPWLEVYVSEVREAIDRESVYVPRAARQEQGRKTKVKASGDLHPAVATALSRR